ncbi:histidinol-phosphatase [Pseudonocardia oroxyli]|uniref:Histidinol-phosphatase n=1 Tax=Pseudonocardia oroxyli TaxID=366584 RepID=A0A1G7VD27_PSEOR|nr:histidinol-phosphatase [Pseudonocardia oroxyli]SDG57461.1 histidinol-phosphatase [Pseudonocardia oroxyli]
MSSAVTEPDTRADLALALELADLADAITLPRFRAADLRVTRKPDRTPVTDADTAAEEALRAAIGGQRPGDAILGEEGGGSVGEGRGWVLDPIDGTKNFSRGMPVWASLIALCSGGVPVVGVVSAPALGRRWWAAARHGAWTSERGGEARRISVTGVTALEDAYLSTTNQETFREFDGMDRWLALSQACWETRAFGDFWQHCLVAEGAIDLAVEPAANPWDLAAVQVLLEEAGGRLTDLRGVPGFAGGDGLASNGHLHEAALRVLQSAE